MNAVDDEDMIDQQQVDSKDHPIKGQYFYQNINYFTNIMQIMQAQIQ